MPRLDQFLLLAEFWSYQGLRLRVIAHGPAPFLNIITLLSIQTLNDDKWNNYHDNVTNMPIFQAAI